MFLDPPYCRLREPVQAIEFDIVVGQMAVIH